jgi:hypothetical protein
MNTSSRDRRGALLVLGTLTILLVATLGCESDCDPDKDEPGTECEKVCDTSTDEKGSPCEREGQICYYGDVDCLYEGVCKNGVWEGASET